MYELLPELTITESSLVLPADPELPIYSGLISDLRVTTYAAPEAELTSLSAPIGGADKEVPSTGGQGAAEEEALPVAQDDQENGPQESEQVLASKSLFRVLREELAHASFLGKVLCVGGVAVVGTHIAVADLAYVNIATDTLSHVSGWRAYVTPGAAVAGASLSIETASTLFVSAALSKFPRLAKWLYVKRFQKDKDVSDSQRATADTTLPEAESLEAGNVPPVDTLATGEMLKGATARGEELRRRDRSSLLAKAATASTTLFMGSPGYILEKYNEHLSPEFGKNVRTGVRAIGALSIVNFTLINGLAAATKNIAELGPRWSEVILTGATKAELGGVIPPAGVVPFLKSPLILGGLFAMSQLLKWNSNRRARNRQAAITNEAEPIDGLSPPAAAPAGV